MPAETPAEVMISHSSTMRASARTSVVGRFAQSVDRRPVRRGVQTVQQSGRPEQKGSGADARRRGAGPALPRYPVEDDRVLLLAAGAIAARNHHEVERRMIVERVIGLHAEPTLAGDDVGPLGDREDLEEPRLGTAFGLPGQGGAGEDFERPTEIKNLHIRKDQDADVSRLRGLGHVGLFSYLWSTCWRLTSVEYASLRQV
jgi:hypothetical protein